MTILHVLARVVHFVVDVAGVCSILFAGVVVASAWSSAKAEQAHEDELAAVRE